MSAKVGNLVSPWQAPKTKGIVTEVFTYWTNSGRGKTFAKVLSYDGREHKFLVVDLRIIEKKVNLFS